VKENVATIVRDIDEKLRVGTGDKTDTGPEPITIQPGPRPVDVAFLTILPEEYDAVLACLDSHQPYQATEEVPNQYAWQYGEVKTGGRGQIYRVVVGMAGQAGTASGVLATLETARVFEPRYVVLVGIAGGLKGAAKGDVVVADTIWGYEYGKIDGGFQPRQNLTFGVDRPLVRLAHVLELECPNEWRTRVKVPSPDSQFASRLLSGPVASGDKVIDQADDSFFAAVITRWPALVAVEMEGAGAANAIHELREKQKSVGFAMIRGISDVPRSGAPVLDAASQTTQRDAWKRFAAHSAAAFATTLVRLRWPIPPRS
jgi:nucleoside phosphorylase